MKPTTHASRSRRFVTYLPRPILGAALASSLMLSAETIKVSGHGETSVSVVKKADAANANRSALAAAEQAARADAVVQALYQVYGNRQKLGTQADAIIKELTTHAGAMVVDSQTKSVNVDGGKAVVDLVLTVDAKAMRDYLENAAGLSLVQEAEGKFKVYVLTYTVDGQDASRTRPQVLHEEITDDRRNVQRSTEIAAQQSDASAKSDFSAAASSTRASASSRSSSLQAEWDAGNKGRASGRSDSSVKYQDHAAVAGGVSARESAHIAGPDGHAGMNASGNAHYAGSVSSALSAQQSSSGSAEWNQHDRGSVNAASSRSNASYGRDMMSAKGSEASSSHSQSASFKDSASDTSTYYHKLVVYADPTKKGAGVSNEVRAKLGELLKSAGFVTGFYDLNLMGREFNNEDELYSTILTNLKQNPDVRPEDYVAVALNRFTPLPGDIHRYTSQVIYRVVRVRDGELLLPDKLLTGDSGEQASDDVARAVATELALAKADDRLATEIGKAMKQGQRTSQREAVAASTKYSVRIDNIANPAVSGPIKQALRSAGFSVTNQFRGTNHSEEIIVGLNGKSGQDVTALLEPLIGSYEVSAMDERSTILRVK